jgi:hypothetical protein
MSSPDPDERHREPVWSQNQAAIVEDMQCKRGEVGLHYALYMRTLATLNRTSADLTQMRVSADFLARYTLQITEGPCPTKHGTYQECAHCAARRMARHIVDLLRAGK